MRWAAARAFWTAGKCIPNRIRTIPSITATSRRENRRPFQHGSGRLELAQAIASKDNPLTARVIVNRVWQQHFGKGLVATPNNFGKMGARPTHPELLDWLATWFIQNGWSLKMLHELCKANLEGNVADPDLRERLRPNYRAACKRLIISPKSLERITRPSEA